MSEKIEKWKAMIKKGQENKSKEQGRLEMLMHRLKTEFEHDTVEDLDKEIEQVEAELIEKQENLLKMKEDFENEFLGKLQIAAQ